MKAAFTTTRSVTIPPVAPALVMEFVTETREGTHLWNALTDWRNDYANKQALDKRFSKLKFNTKTYKEVERELHTATKTLERAYAKALTCFERARKSPEIGNRYDTQLAAIAHELHIEFKALGKGQQLSLPLDA